MLSVVADDHLHDLCARKHGECKLAEILINSGLKVTKPLDYSVADLEAAYW